MKRSCYARGAGGGRHYSDEFWGVGLGGLPSLLRATGLSDVRMNVVHPAGFEGEVKLIAPITLEAIADAVMGADLCATEELNQTVDDLYAFAADEGSVLSTPRVVQVWGRKR